VRPRWGIINAGAIGGLLILVLYYLGVRPNETFSPIRQVDFHYWYQIPPLVLQKLEYPSLVPQGWHEHIASWHVNYSYPPSALVMMLPLYAFPRPVAFGIWLLLQAICFFAVLLLSMRLAGVADWPSRWLIAAGAVLLAQNPIGWDLRNHNVNVLYLALVLAGVASRSSWVGGALLGLSFNLKLYSASLFAGLAWWRDYRRLAAMLACSIVISLLPILVVGFSGFATLLKEWIGQVAFTATDAGDALAPTSMRRGIAVLLSSEPASPEVYWIWRALQGIWAGLVVCYFVLVPRERDLHDTAGAWQLADLCVLLMAPLPLSTWFVPYHAVVIIPALILLISVAVDARWTTATRVSALVACVAPQALLLFLSRWELRSVAYYLSFLALLMGIAIMRLSAHRALSATGLRAPGVFA
jgi:hypothetical protein